MSEQNNIIQFPGNREGSRLDDDDFRADFRKNITVPGYNADEIAATHETEAARVAQEAARQLLEIKPDHITPVLNSLSKLTAKRIAAQNGEIVVNNGKAA